MFASKPAEDGKKDDAPAGETVKQPEGTEA